mmetsp:Transcript_113755/g.223129  ORF Transcript_113755/g.223129 Transcript_113755/m.223129 type:complete len:389 (+) Transcript_113755:46-1212(+)
MKFSALILAAAVVTGADAFVAPSSSSAAAAGRLQQESSTELNLFGLFKGAGATKVRPTEAASKLVPPSEVVAPTPSEDTIRALFHLWNDALATGEPRLVAKRYAKDAVLLPTVSDEPRMDQESIVDYFETFLKLKPQGEILVSKVYVGAGFAKDVGVYEFTMGATKKKVKARYTFVYVYEDGQWKILHQHSSQMPEQVTPNDAPKLTAEQVRNLFHLWNDALDTLDAQAVANRFTKDAVLLPTVSDVPRTTPEAIKDYFEMFLKSKPQGKVLESYVEFGPSWAKDCGIYEFTMRGDNNKIVRARFTFVYQYVDGQWKIAHQHSSQMPEGLMAAAAACEEKLKQDKLTTDNDNKSQVNGSQNSSEKVAEKSKGKDKKGRTLSILDRLKL